MTESDRDRVQIQKPAGSEASTSPRRARPSSPGSRAVVVTAFTVGAIVLVNVISAVLSGRLDLTDDHIYTLSPASKDLVRSLPDPVTVKAYVSRDLPPELASRRRYLHDLLGEYRTSSEGKLRLDEQDPASDPKVEAQATRCGVGQMAVQALRGEKLEIGRHFFGLCLWYNGRSRALVPIDQTAALEYQVSALIKSMTQRRRKVAVTTGHGEQDLGQGYSFVKHGLDQEYEVVTMNPSVNSLTDDIDALIIAGPRQPFDDKGRREIDGFLRKGRAALFLVDGMALAPEPSPQRQQPPQRPRDQRIGRPIDTGLEELLGRYGFRIGRHFVFDRQNVPGPVPSPGGTLFANLPAYVSVKADRTLTRDLSILAGVDAMVFPFASAVDLVGPLAADIGKRGRLWALATTSPEAWREQGPFDISASRPPEPGATDRGPATLAYAYHGALDSAYPETDLASPSRQGSSRSASRKAVRLVVVGDSDFVSDEYMQLMRSFPIYAGGAQMAFNAISWLLEDDALTQLRAAGLPARPLRIDSEDRLVALKWANVIGAPLVFCAAGLVRWRLRLGARRRQHLGREDEPS